ncbi:hypothetical protein KSP39_PZI013021 [Platanthera zijinensis]|uniref:Uncharacterized protein n=1 Tax=Platanthera zijinensis TaxID=2320716 RepID=A0AAP0BDQ6_9ASPA
MKRGIESLGFVEKPLSLTEVTTPPPPGADVGSLYHCCCSCWCRCQPLQPHPVSVMSKFSRYRTLLSLFYCYCRHTFRATLLSPPPAPLSPATAAAYSTLHCYSAASPFIPAVASHSQPPPPLPWIYNQPPLYQISFP